MLSRKDLHVISEGPIRRQWNVTSVKEWKMEVTDYSGIDATRVPEARRRVAALNAYLKLYSPTKADTMHFAGILGLSRVQFGRLVRVWRDHRDPSLLVIGKRGASTRDYGVVERAIEIAQAVIEEADTNAKLTEVAAEVNRRCAIEKLRAPSQATIWTYIKKARAIGGHAANNEPPRIVIGRMWFRLPVNEMPADAMPMLLAAVLLPERFIVAHAISVDPESPPSVSALIDALERNRTFGAAKRPVHIAADDRRAGAAALDRAGLNGTRSYDRSVQRELSKSYGGKLGPLDVIYQRGMAKPASSCVITRQQEALSAEAVVEAVEAAITSSNGAAITETPAFDLTQF